MEKGIINASTVRKAIGFDFEMVFEGASAKTKEWCRKRFGTLDQELIWYCRRLWFQIDNGLASSSEQPEEILEALHYLDEGRFIRHDIKAKSFMIDYFREVVFAPDNRHVMSSVDDPIIITQFDDFAIGDRFDEVVSLNDRLANQRYEEYVLPTKKDLDDFQMGLGSFLGPKGVEVVCYMYGIDDGRLHTDEEVAMRCSTTTKVAACIREKIAFRKKGLMRRRELPLALLSARESFVVLMAGFESVLENTLGSVRTQNIVNFGSSFESKCISVTLKKAPLAVPNKASMVARG